MHQQYMNQALQLAADNIANNGKPFGAVIVKEGMVVGTGVNEVTQTGDPTAHAEIQAIRKAMQNKEETFLKGAVMYASGHPCPMCLAAMYLSGFQKIYYHTPLEAVEGTQLDVKPIYGELQKDFAQQAIPLIQLNATLPIDPVQTWLDQQKQNKP
jgi:guanine deaminase